MCTTLPAGERLERLRPLSRRQPQDNVAVVSPGPRIAFNRSRSVDAARFETGGVRLSHLRGQVARHFHAHADLTNFGRRPYHRVVPSSGLRAPLMGHTRVNSATRSFIRRSTQKGGPKAAVDAALEVWLSSPALRQVAWLTGLA
jgi:hypothetical protein